MCNAGDLRLLNDRYKVITQGACLIIIIMLYISVISSKMGLIDNQKPIASPGRPKADNST